LKDLEGLNITFFQPHNLLYVALELDAVLAKNAFGVGLFVHLAVSQLFLLHLLAWISSHFLPLLIR